MQAQIKRKPHPLSEGSKQILKCQVDTAKFVEEELVALGYMKANEYCSQHLLKVRLHWPEQERHKEKTRARSVRFRP